MRTKRGFLSGVVLSAAFASVGLNVFKVSDANAAETTPDGWEYEYVEDGDYGYDGTDIEILKYHFTGIKITNYVGAIDSALLTVPAEIDGKPVVVAELSGGSISGSNAITRLVVSDGIKVFQARGFSNVSEISLPDSLEIIPERAFLNTYRFRSIEIPANVRHIGTSAFSSSMVENLTFASDSKLETISANAFSNSCRLEGRIVFPEGLKTIGDRAFECNAAIPNITELVIPGSVLSIGRSAFDGLNKLKTMVIYGNPTIVSDLVPGRGYVGERVELTVYTTKDSTNVINHINELNAVDTLRDINLVVFETFVNEITEEFVYESEVIEPRVVVVYRENDGAMSAFLAEGIDYAVTYENNNAPGTGRAIINFKDSSAYFFLKPIVREFTIVAPVILDGDEDPEDGGDSMDDDSANNNSANGGNSANDGGFTDDGGSAKGVENADTGDPIVKYIVICGTCVLVAGSTIVVAKRMKKEA